MSSSESSLGASRPGCANRIVHGYWSIDLDVVHATAPEHLPGFTADQRRVLAAVAAQDDEGPADRLLPVTRAFALERVTGIAKGHEKPLTTRAHQTRARGQGRECCDVLSALSRHPLSTFVPSSDSLTRA